MKHSVLLVDDEQSICSALQRTLKKSAYHVYAANSGEQALELLEREKVDVIVSDQRMPGMNGTQLLSVVKNKYPQVGRVMLSGYSDFEALTNAVNSANIFRFLAKPWNDETLIETIDEAVIHTAGQQPKPAAYPSVTAETTTAKVAPPIPIANALINRQINLEKAIKNDELTLNEQPLFDINATGNTINYFLLDWPKLPSSQHKSIIEMACQAGYVNELYTWYILKSIDCCDTQTLGEKKIVIDLFCEDMIANKPLRSLLSSVMHQNCHLVFRVPFDLLGKSCLNSLLMETYDANASIMLNIGQRTVDAKQFKDTPINFLEMDGDQHIIRNQNITEQRKKMLEDAHYLSIKTILRDVKHSEQFLYAKHMSFDFFIRKKYKKMNL